MSVSLTLVTEWIDSRGLLSPAKTPTSSARWRADLTQQYTVTLYCPKSHFPGNVWIVWFFVWTDKQTKRTLLLFFKILDLWLFVFEAETIWWYPGAVFMVFFSLVLFIPSQLTLQSTIYIVQYPVNTVYIYIYIYIIFFAGHLHHSKIT